MSAVPDAPNDELDAFAYVHKHYGVPACTGRRVTINNRTGTVIPGGGAHIMVHFDGAKYPEPCHPTWSATYHDEVTDPPKIPRGRARYLRWLERDGDESFGDFLRHYYGRKS